MILIGPWGMGLLALSSITAPWFAPSAAWADEISPALMESLKSIPVPHTKLFLKYHGELLEHNLELASKCFECHQDKRMFCVSCHAVVYSEEEAGESGETESEDWERFDLGHEDINEDLTLFEKLGIPLVLREDE